MIWFYWYRLCAQSRFKYSKSMCLKFVRVAINAIKIIRIDNSRSSLFFFLERLLSILFAARRRLHFRLQFISREKLNWLTCVDARMPKWNIDVSAPSRRVQTTQRVQLNKTVCLIRTDGFEWAEEKKTRNNFHLPFSICLDKSCHICCSDYDIVWCALFAERLLFVLY